MFLLHILANALTNTILINEHAFALFDGLHLYALRMQAVLYMTLIAMLGPGLSVA